MSGHRAATARAPPADRGRRRAGDRPPRGRAVGEPPYEPTLESLDRHPVPEWYQDAKSGSSSTGRSSPYPPTRRRRFPADGALRMVLEAAADTGSPTCCITCSPTARGSSTTTSSAHGRPSAAGIRSQWIDLFEQAGARYFILVAKHKDGFALWRPTPHDGTRSTMGPGTTWSANCSRRRASAADQGSGALLDGEWFSPAPNPDLPLDDPANLSPTRLARWGTWRPAPVHAASACPTRLRADRRITGGDQVFAQLSEIIDRFTVGDLCDLGGNHATYYHSHDWMAHFYNQPRLQPRGVLVNDRWRIRARTPISP